MIGSAAAHRAANQVAGLVLRRVAGPDPRSARDRIHRAPGPRWFPSDSPIARVHGDASMFVGGVRALLLQSLHPRAMAAVAAHSGYRGDPWGRLQRTATFIATTTFGTVEDAERTVAVVRAVHKRVRGVTSEGEEYAASDPHLLRWVHLAEIDSFLLAHQRYGRDPLDAAGCDEYVAQTAQVSERLGTTGLPRTVAELGEQLAEYRPELRRTAEARAAAQFLLLTPPLPLLARPPYWLIAAAGVGLMPGWSRRPLGLPHVPVLDRTVVRQAGRLVTGTIRWALDAAAAAEAADIAAEQSARDDDRPAGSHDATLEPEPAAR